MAELEAFRLERFFAKHEFTARRLLCSSDCETTTVAELLAMEEGAAEGLMDFRLGYTETRGAPALREAIAALYAPRESGGPGREGIFVHAGAEEAILNLCLALVEEGDHVVVNTPAYQSLEELPRWRGAAVSRWELRDEGSRWLLDPDELGRLLGPKTKLVIMNAPHNPTGALPAREEFDAIVERCRRAGAFLLVDEVYRGLEREPDRALPPACEAYEKGISLNVLSKTAGLAGLRIGWVATRRDDVLEALARVKDYNSICASGPSEFLAGIAIRNFQQLAERNRARCDANLTRFDSFVRRHPEFISYTPPEGSSICFPRLSGRAESDFGRDAEAMALSLLADTGILLLPGSLYAEKYARNWRLGFGREDFAEGLAEWETWVTGKGY